MHDDNHQRNQDDDDDDHPGDANPAARPIRRDRTRWVGDSRALSKWGAADWSDDDDGAGDTGDGGDDGDGDYGGDTISIIIIRV